MALGLRACFFLALAQYLAGAWDDVLVSAGQGRSALAIRPRRYELPLLHLAAGCVPAGRGAGKEAERRIGNRKDAVQRLRGAHDLYRGLRAAPFLARTEEELAACNLPGSPDKEHQPVLTLTSRETEVAHLVGKGLSNPEIAAELFISRKAVEYHLGNIYAKCGLQGRQQLRRFVEQWRQPTAA
jgi:DNA-binding CsgD family transcriptional regulator